MQSDPRTGSTGNDTEPAHAFWDQFVGSWFGEDQVQSMHETGARAARRGEFAARCRTVQMAAITIGAIVVMVFATLILGRVAWLVWAI